MIDLSIKEANKAHYGHAQHSARDNNGENDDGHDALRVD